MKSLHTLIYPEDVHLYHVTDSADAAVEEILKFYRNYHSMRYVNDFLVVRINAKLPETRIEQMNKEFKDILVAGAIEQRDALPEESNEPELNDLPRLYLHFNRRSIGRLRQLINLINAS